jgi:hypothetical protein
MERSITSIGGKIFPAIGGNYKLSPEGGKESFDYRYNRSAVTGVALAAITATGQADFTFTVQTLKPEIVLDYIAIRINFLDAAAGTYNVSQLGIIVLTATLNNSDFDDPTSYVLPADMAHGRPLNFRVALTSARQFTLRSLIQAGDVARLSGITPGAGDTVNFFATVGYYL